MEEASWPAFASYWSIDGAIELFLLGGVCIESFKIESWSLVCLGVPWTIELRLEQLIWSCPTPYCTLLFPVFFAAMNFFSCDWATRTAFRVVSTPDTWTYLFFSTLLSRWVTDWYCPDPLTRSESWRRIPLAAKLISDATKPPGLAFGNYFGFIPPPIPKFTCPSPSLLPPKTPST